LKKENQIKISASRNLKENLKLTDKKETIGLMPPLRAAGGYSTQQKLKIIATLRDGNAF
jgi:hypothetical protein